MLELIENSPPLLAGRYELYGAIDTSGSTLQYLGWDRDAERWCTVGILARRSMADALTRQRFEREIRVLESLQHPHIIRVFESAPKGPDVYWSVSEVAEGGTVLDWVAENGPMPAVLAIDVMVQVCGALSAAHQNGASHGHLHGGLVLVDRHSSCKLVGLRGEGARGDIMADIRASGALLFQLLTGREWDDGRGDQQLVGLPGSLGRAIGQATRKGRGGYPGILAFSRDLEAAVLELPMPDGAVPPLAGPTAALPDDPALVWDPATRFPDLEQLLGQGEPVVAEPPAPEPVAPESSQRAPSYLVEDAEPETGGTPVSGGSVSSGGSPLPYQMASSSKKDFDETSYASGGTPLYIEEEAKKAPDAWDEQWTPEEAEAEEQERIEKLKAEEREAQTERLLVRLTAASAVVMVLALAATLFVGTTRVNDAHASWESAASALVAAVRQDSGIIYQLANSGADRQAMEAAYAAFDSAPTNVERIRSAAAFATIVEAEARAKGMDAVSKAGTMDSTASRIGELQKARQQFDDRLNVHRQTAGAFPGNVSVLLGLGQRPFESE